MPQFTNNSVRKIDLTMMAIILVALPGCLGGASVDDARAAQFEAAMSTWVLGIEGLTFELGIIQDEERVFHSLATVRDHVKKLQGAIKPLGELYDNDASYIESKYGDLLREVWLPYSAEAQRMNITGGIPTEISELLRDIPEFGPR